jgi:hypothetical protein
MDGAHPSLARDRQIPALHGEISAGNGDLSIPFEQKEVTSMKYDIVKVVEPVCLPRVSTCLGRQVVNHPGSVGILPPPGDTRKSVQVV